MSDRAEHLFSLIGQVDDALIDAAARPLPVPRPQRRWPKRAALLAACLALTVGLWRAVPGWLSWSGNNGSARPPAGQNDSAGDPGTDLGGSDGASPGDAPSPPGGDYSTGEGAPPEQVSSLPTLEYQPQFAEGTGITGFLVAAGNDPHQAVQDYLSDAITLPDGADTLPVYQSTIERSASGVPVFSDEDAMESLLEEVLARLGLTQTDCTITRTTSEGWDASGQEDVSLIYLEAGTSDGKKVIISYDLTYRVYLPLDTLPPDFPQSADITTQQGALAQGQAIIRMLGTLLDMDTPVCRLTGGGTDLDGKPARYYITISEDRDPLSSLPHPTVSTWGCDGTERGLWLNFNPKLTQKLVGEYPIISATKARKEVLTGKWSPDGTVPAEEDICRSELVYCTDISGLTMPYYCFYLYRGEISNNEHEIECRYVPAVAREYLNQPS